jgi:hypothetical protein
MSTCPPLISGHSAITVDYGMTFEEMIAAGRYQSKNVDIDIRRFPLNGQGIVEYESRIFHFKREITSEQASELIRSDDRTDPWTPASVEHLLAYADQNSGENRNYPLVGLGFVGEVVGHRRVPYLGRDVSQRVLYFLWWVFDWDEDCRFLAVRKKNPTEAAR